MKVTIVLQTIKIIAKKIAAPATGGALSFCPIYTPTKPHAIANGSTKSQYLTLKEIPIMNMSRARIRPMSISLKRILLEPMETSHIVRLAKEATISHPK